MTTPHIEVIELTTQVVEIIELAKGPKGDAGDAADSSLTPEVNAALGAATDPSADNPFTTQSNALALIIALGG